MRKQTAPQGVVFPFDTDMEYNPGDGQGIIDDIAFHLGDAVDLNNYPIEDRTRNVNQWLSTVWTWIFEAYGGWKFMDDGESDTTTGVPYADQTVTSGTGLYGLPTESAAIDAAFILLSAGSTFTKLKPLTHEEFLHMGGDGFFSSPGTPWAYLLQGDILRLLPTPNFTLANALRVFFEKDMVKFAVDDTTATPGFLSTFHRILSLGASLDYAQGHGMPEKITSLNNTLYATGIGYKDRLSSFYSKRYKDRFPAKLQAGKDIVSEFS